MAFNWLRAQNDLDELNVSDDPVSHPAHYTGVRVRTNSGRVGADRTVDIECKDLLVALGFDKNAFLYSVGKYLWRAGKKSDALEDLRKARVYLDWEIAALAAEREAGV